MQTQVPGRLPEVLNFMLQVERKRIIEGNYPVKAMPRLSAALFNDEGFVSVKLEFDDSAGFACLQGEVTAALTLECQRCLQPMQVTVAGSIKFALVHREQDFESLPDDYEPYLVEGEEQSIINIVEDELLLGIPMVTMHENACSDFMKEQDAVGGVREQMRVEKEASNPFAALQALKGEKTN